MSELNLIARASVHAGRVAIADAGGSHRYQQLLDASEVLARALSARAGRDGAGLSGERIAYLLRPGFDHVATQWGIWRAGGLAVPLSAAQAPAEWRYVIEDTDARLVVVEGEFLDAMRAAAAGTVASVVTRDDVARFADPATGDVQRGASAGDALILYTSGTTGKPKGVVLTHANLEAQVRCLASAWQWEAHDRILHVLPLHHVHGIVNVLTCALWVGATCEMAPRFEQGPVWDALAAGRLTLFMAVPTIYSKLIAAWESAPPHERVRMSNGCRAMRLMVSGSAALPVRVLEQWKQISGHVLLERYGMTEIGMALSNPLHGERRPGSVGVPLPGVDVRIVSEQGDVLPEGTPGELEVRGPGVFREYWRRPQATESAFREGWFRTGDVAVVDNGMYRLLGRQSVDIIKSGGYKISALEIEEVLRDHPAIAECAVVGVPDVEWGERIAVAALPAGSRPLDLDELREWARSRLSRYKLPTLLRVVNELPRNPMGKVSKPKVKELFDP